MKKRLLWIIIFFIIGMVLIYIFTNPKIEKWTYDLPNNYAIKKTSETNVVLGKYIDNIFEIKDNNKQVGIEDYIAEFSYGKRYVSLKCLKSSNDNIIVKFYIVDTKEDNIYGPYNDEETYKEVKNKIVDEELNDWIKTTTKPEKAINRRKS